MTTASEPDRPPVASATAIPDESRDAGEGGIDSASEVSSLGYEQARDELIRIVATLEGGRVGLEESMTLWQRGEALAARCTEWLDAAEAGVPPPAASGPVAATGGRALPDPAQVE